MTNIIPQEHKILIDAIKKLPEFSILTLWTPHQFAFLKDKQQYWTYLGERIDYHQKIQLGFRPTEPSLPDTLHDLLREQVRVAGDYLFWMLQVVIEGFDDVKIFVTRKQGEFPFNDPRELFAQMCHEFSYIEVSKIISHDIGVGETLTKIRSAQSLTGKLLRFSLSEKEEKELCCSLEASGFWYGLVMAAIIGTSRRYLNKANNQRGLTWKKFKDAQKEMHRLCNAKHERSGAFCSVAWNSGYPIYLQTSKPVLHPLVQEFLNLS